MAADVEFSAFGPRPLPIVRQTRCDIAIAVCEATAEAEVMNARTLARSNPDEAEGLIAHAEQRAGAYAIVAAMLRGQDLPAGAFAPDRASGPAAHKCDFEGCGADAGFGFGMRNEPNLWACRKHRAEVGARFEREENARIERAKAILEKPADNNLAGIGDRLI